MKSVYGGFIKSYLIACFQYCSRINVVLMGNVFYLRLFGEVEHVRHSFI